METSQGWEIDVAKEKARSLPAAGHILFDPDISQIPPHARNVNSQPVVKYMTQIRASKPATALQNQILSVRSGRKPIMPAF